MNNDIFKVISFNAPFAIGLASGQAPLHGFYQGSTHRGWCLVHALPYSGSPGENNLLGSLLDNYPYNEILGAVGISTLPQLAALSNSFVGWAWLEKIKKTGISRHGNIQGPDYTWHFTKGSLLPEPIKYIGGGWLRAPDLWDLPPIMDGVFFTPSSKKD